MNDQVTPQETAALLDLANQALSVPGDFVELGCYRGDTSILLGQLLQKAARPLYPCGKAVENSGKTSIHPVENSCKNPPASVENLCKTLWIYDSFAGLPEKTREDASGAGTNFQSGELFVTKREVTDKLRRHGLKVSSHPLTGTSSIIVKKAWFDQLQAADLPDRIAFAFCDGDLYSSITTSLQLVLPRLSPQGIIVVHDYNNPELPGSARAVDSFLKTHPDFTLKVHYTLAILTKKC